MLASVIGLYVVVRRAGDADVPHLGPGRSSTSTRPRSGGCSSASSSPSRSRRRCSRCTPGCPTPPRRPRPGRRVLLVSVLDKIGTFGMIRFCLGLFPEASRVGHAGRHRARADRDRLRRAARHRPGRHAAADRRTRRSRTSGSSCSASSCSPARAAPVRSLYMVNHGLATAAAVPGRRHADPARRHAADRDYGGVQKVAPVLAGVVPGGRPRHLRPARPVAVRQRVPGADLGVRLRVVGRCVAVTAASCWPRSTSC